MAGAVVPEPGGGEDGGSPLRVPDYDGACIANLLPALRSPGAPPTWLPAPAIGARQIVLLVLDGLGWEQLRERPGLMPCLSGLAGGPVTSVAPTTTASALTSITTGLPPAGHGVLGYRVKVGRGEVLNVLRWRTPSGDARREVVPEQFQPHPVFGARPFPVVTRAEFATTGFTRAHLPGAPFWGWRVQSSLTVTVRALLDAGEPLVYAYYDGVDKVAHEYGFGPHLDAELRAADLLVADLAGALPPGAALVVVADHGQVEVGDASLPLGPDLLAHSWLVSGEGRFRWLHARPGMVGRVAEEAEAAFGGVAAVRTREELEDAGWFGGRLTDAGRSRLGDVALIAREAVAFTDPADPGELTLRCRHGSLTAAEMLVPLLAVAR